MTKDVWTGYGNWSTLEDWSLGLPPTSSQSAEIAGNCTISASGQAYSLTIDAGKSLSLTAGASLTTTKYLNNAGVWNVDGDGASATLGGVLINSGTVTIGYASLKASTTVQTTNLINSGSLIVQGNVSNNDAAHRSTLNITGAAPSGWSGYGRVSGNAVLQFGSGGIGYVQSGAWLELDGSGAKILTGGGASSALKGFHANNGNLFLRGDGGNGAGGATLLTATDFLNTASFGVDDYGRDGGSLVVFGGVFSNTGGTEIGNTALSASTTVSATGLSNSGSLSIQGNAASGTTNQAALKISGAAPGTWLGKLRVAGDGLLQFGSGMITSIAANSSIELDGAQAQILTNGGAASALSGLAANDGILALGGDHFSGAGGVNLATTAAFTNRWRVFVDMGFGDGGSSASFGGVFYNYGTTGIGNNGLRASTTVSAAGLFNTGFLSIQGNGTSGTTNQAALKISGAAPGTWSGKLKVIGDGLLQFASGGITSIAANSSLELRGSQAQILTNNGADSALSSLATNYGILRLSGNDALGAGGASLATTSAFTNYATFTVDSYYYGTGGSTASFGGAFVNNGTTTIGNIDLSASTTVSATGLSNTGSLTIQGEWAGGGIRASLIVNGAAPGTWSGKLRVAGGGLLQFASGGIASVAANSSLELDGSSAQILTNGGSASALSSFASNYGTLLLRGGSNHNSGWWGGAKLVTASTFTNHATFNIDMNDGDGGSTASFGGIFVNYGTTTIGNINLGAATSVTAAGLTNSGTMTIVGSSAYLAELIVNGDVTDSGNLTIAANGELNAGTHSFTQTAGTANIAGTLAAATINANGGLIDFTSVIGGGSGVGALNIGANGALEFQAGADATHAVQFMAGTGDLEMTDPADFKATIKGFASSDLIDLIGVSVSGFSYSGTSSAGTLSLTLSSGSAALAFAGNYTTGSFATLSDGNGGTFIVHT